VAGRFGPSARLTPANAITAARLLATPVVIVVIVKLGVSWAAATAWVAMASTDFLDGWVARRQGATTSGAFLDPLADKVLVLGALFALAALGLAWWLPVALLSGRELLVSGYRSVQSRRGVSVPARPLAKAKTLAEDAAVALLVMPATGLHERWIGEWVLWGAVALAVLSAAQYLSDSRPRVLPAPAAATAMGAGALGTTAPPCPGE
jgi:CDP-diacylglycerol--glycerol-3-phosphate 3-phosphatidyltransferase